MAPKLVYIVLKKELLKPSEMAPWFKNTPNMSTVLPVTNFSKYCYDDEMNGVLGHDSPLQSYIGPGTAWATGNWMNFVVNYAQGAGSMVPVDQQSCALPLCDGCPLLLL